MARNESSITDQPIECIENESLGTGDYAMAMSDFILHCSTPLTIGIQGEWGSGKTSLMHLIKEEITKKNIASAWLNTWEYAMFRAPEEIAPAVLRGMLEGLKDAWPVNYPWPNAMDEKIQKVKGLLRGIGKFALEAGVKQVTGASGGATLAADSAEFETRTEIAEVRRQLVEIIEELIRINSNPFEKVVFFIDDLDRIEPSTAVNILESLKNIFDIKHCVFVLAIDYDIVVKGLQSKFGEKTEKNEREFRSFFDKIIQVPFSMPIGAYDIDLLINNFFNSLGFEIDSKLAKSYRECVSLTVGGNPRSIKRYVNTYSLLRRMRDLHERDTEDGSDALDDFTLFFLIGIQVAYPKIYQLLLLDVDFNGWDNQFADNANITIDVPEQYKENEYLDETWEQILWSTCQRDTYLKARALQVLTAFNLLRKLLGKDNLADKVGKSLLITNITSVDDDQESNQKKFQRIRLDNLDQFIGLQKDKGFNSEGLDLLRVIHDYIETTSDPNKFTLSIAPGQISYYSHNRNRKRVFLYLSPSKSAGPRLYFTNTKKRIPIDNLEAFNDIIKQDIEKSRAQAPMKK